MSPRFASGDRVRVKAGSPSGHIRTPAYVRGRSGWVARVHGEFRNPENLAYGGDGLPRQALYMVGFRQTDLWPAHALESARDTVFVDIYEHWLAAEGHEHAHDVAQHDPEAAERNRVPILGQRIYAIRELLIEKGVLSREDVQAQIAYMDARSPANGARLVARAWVDPAFKQRLLTDPKAACGDLGIDASGLTEFVVLENTAEVHNLVVCTLCSCYPRPILGRPPDWYKSFAYRSRAVVEPRAVMREFGTELPPEVTVRVVDSSADIRYLVLPQRPAGTDGLSEAELAALVTRDSLIGVTLPKAPTVSSGRR